jgi:hypothetical protein
MTLKFLFLNCKETFLLHYATRTWFVMSIAILSFYDVNKTFIDSLNALFTPLIQYNIIYVRC